MMAKHIKNVWASCFSVLTFLAIAGVRPANAMVLFAPIITSEPTNQTVAAEGTATLSVTAEGNPSPGYQWYFDNAGITDATNSVLTLSDVQPGEAGAYYVVLTNSYGSATSAIVTLTVDATFPPEAPYIITEPTNQTATAGDTATFSIIAVGGDSLTYQWYLNGTNLWGATNATLILDDASPGNAGPYFATVADAEGSVTSAIVTLTVNPASSSSEAPYIITQPTNQTVINGRTTTFSVTAGGAAPLSYQWYFDGTILPGTNATLLVPLANSDDAGSYYVTIANAYGSTNSATVILTVLSTGPTESPYIVEQPTNETVTAGDTASFSATIVGAAPRSYLWYFNGTNVVGTNAILVLDDVTAADAGSYQLFISNAYGSTNTAPATLTVSSSAPSQAPYIIAQPTNQTVTAGGTATFSVTVSGAAPLEYLWFFDGTNVVGTNATLVLDDVTTANAGSYQVFISNAYGSTNSVAAMLSVNSSSPSQAPYIIAQPTNQTVTAGGTATFSVTVSGAAPLEYLWYFDGTNIVGTNATLILDDVTTADAGSYQVFVENAYGSTNSVAATLSVNSSSPSQVPYITAQPTNQTVTAGSTATFSVTVSGAAPLEYLWYFDGTNIVGTNATLILDDVTTADAGAYQVFIENAYGSTNSVPVTLTVYSSSCDPVPSGIVSWWPGEGNANDVIGTNNGIASPGLGYTTGEVGQAFAMDATNANFYAPASASLDVGAHGTGLTIEAWIDPSNVNGLQPIVEWNSSPEYPPHSGSIGVQFWIGQNPGSQGVLCATFMDTNVQNGEYIQVTSPSGALVPNVWQHVAVTYEPTNGYITLYINGATVASQYWGQIVPPTSYNFWVGHRPGDEPGDWTYGTFLSGPLDELSLYNRALSSNEIAAIYQAGSEGKCPPPPPSMAPYIITQPANQTVTAGGTATFSVTAGGAAPLEYLWYFDGTNIVGTNATLVLNDVTTADAGAYQVFVENAYGSTNSVAATLTVNSSGPSMAPYIATQPANQTATAGGTAAFSVTAGGTAPLSYLWYFDETNVVGTNATLVLSNTVPANAGVYQAFVSNAYGSTNSVPVTLTVRGPMLIPMSHGKNLQIGWPVNPSGFVLEMTTNLALGNWVPAPGQPLQSSNQWIEAITSAATNGPIFYRLHFTGQ